MLCGPALAIDNAWTPSCCLICSEVKFALSSARLASTRLPTPTLRMSTSWVVKSVWISTRLAAAPSEARPFDTAVIAVLMEVRAKFALALVVRLAALIPSAVTERSCAVTMMVEPSTVDRTAKLVPSVLIRLTLLNSAVATIVLIWFRSAS